MRAGLNSRAHARNSRNPANRDYATYSAKYAPQFLEARAGIEPACKDLQSSASPLRHRASGKQNA